MADRHDYVLSALCEELVRVKDNLDRFVRGDRQHADELASLLAPLRQIADTLAVLGFGQPRKVIIDQLLVVQGLVQGAREANDAVLMDVAGALLYVEATLAGMVGPAEPAEREEDRLPTTDLKQIHRLVIKETRFGLQQARDMLVDYADSHWERQRLQGLPALLTQLRGALAMLVLERAAALVQCCEDYVQAQLLSDVAHPDSAQLDQLAEAITAIEYYLERLSDDPQTPAERVLDVAEAGLAALGYRLAEAATPAKVSAKPEVAAELDPQLLEIFHNEALNHLTSLNRFLALDDNQQGLPISDELQRALHTLKGSALVAGVLPVAELATAMDFMARELRAHQVPLEPVDLALLSDAEYLMRSKLQQLPQDPFSPIAGAPALIEQLQQRTAARLESAREHGNPQVRGRDPQVIERFLAEAMDILLECESLLQRWQQHPGERHELTALLDGLTTLGEGAHLADLTVVDELCEALLDLYGAAEESSLAVDAGFFAEADEAQEALLGMLDQLAAGQQVQAQPQRVQALRKRVEGGLDPQATGVVQRDGSGVIELGAVSASVAEPSVDDDLVELFLDEAADILDLAAQTLQRWLVDPDSAAPLQSLQRDLHTLKGGARMSGMDAIAELAHALEAVYEALVQRRLQHCSELEQALVRSHAHLQLMLEQLQQRQPLTAADSLIDLLNGLRQSEPLPAPADAEGTPDTELLDIFIEEGLDIVESAGAALLRWQAEPDNSLEVENLLRDLHTLKGGARMVEVGPLGDLAHELESVYAQLSAGQLQASIKLFGLLQKGHDRLAQMLDAVRSGTALPAAGKLIAAIHDFAQTAEPSVPAAPPKAAVEPGAVERGPVDVVKVAAELLDDLGNLAGETSIFRGRIEQQVNDAQAALQEMEITIERMRDQLRRLDTETQSRILSRQQVDGHGYEDFDPLEMDRHSQLQQLSRALFESASDLLDLKETLAGRNLEAQTLLQQQARVNTELQEGLMRTRMVPFERLLPRLQRVVRQVAEELGKEVEFEVSEAQGEMDRSVLERMIAPLEHMLRNAVDHGLEPVEARLAAGKPAQGHIRLALLHQGGDIVIEMSDDGAGVPLEAVRAKAIKRGLLDPASDMSDHDVLQFILQPGFSTATKITQISGRGLGMDVVHEEVKQLGGAMSIDSRPGQGARFQIRLPFTVSVNRALMVQCGDDQYAIPLNSIEGIVRVMPGELQDAYQSDPPRYGYAGRVYDLRYLATLLHGTPSPSLVGQMVPLPVLLVRAFDQQVAVQVDALAGSREIVVKGLGPQFAAVPGLSGATILGDGRVVLILDLLAQLRAAQTQPQRSVLHHRAAAPARRLQVLVVDDSVTVRKVTSRLLERHGMQVLTAKDGVDAMTLLQEHSPDVMLLDIEMPRMDGFEVATQVRHHPTLKDLPIIMITSRTGQKHRERAMAIGVNEYLGKPYQESHLLACIAHWSRQHA
jgi:chemosensory pili system protein ChpA (sensor histidine kinase/response regulator)